MGGETMDGGNMMMGWGCMFFGLLMMIAFLALIIVAIVMLAKSISGSSPNNHSSDEPLNILQKRLASGEINQAEYEEIKRQLEA